MLRLHWSQTSQLRRQQDDDLDMLGAQVTKIGMVGRAIHDELGTQSHMLEELEQDTDETQTRLQVQPRTCCQSPQIWLQQ